MSRTRWLHLSLGSALLVLGLSLTANKAAAPDQALPPLRVTVTLLGGPIKLRPAPIDKSLLGTSKNRTSIRFAGEGWAQEFPVLLCVTNLSSVPVSFVTYGCSWWENWQGRVISLRSKDEIYVGERTSCYANPRSTITLKPGEAYRKQSIVSIRVVGNPHSVRFQIGLTPEFNAPQNVLWSNELLATVTKAYGK